MRPTSTPPRGPLALELDWDALEIAVERNAPDTDSFLDLATGKVVTIVAGDPEAPLRRQQVGDNIRNFLRVEPASSREQYRWMERFVGSVADEQLRERLIISIDGKGAFRRFKDVLLAYPAERERWFSYRADLLHWHIRNWLAENDITATNEPPWGQAQPPPELPVVPGKPVVHGAEAPGEALRRQARDLIETIPAIDLPSAIAFLEFLRQRSVEAMARDKERGIEADAPDADSNGSGSGPMVGSDDRGAMVGGDDDDDRDARRAAS
jgi:hypothetical protein